MTKKILFVDDHLDMIEMLTYRLIHEGYDVISCSDGITAYDLYVKEKPDLIILDVMLPGLNGYEVCRKIRREDNDNSTPILMLTAKDDDGDRIVGRVIGANIYMNKPFESDRLLYNIRRLLED